MTVTAQPDTVLVSRSAEHTKIDQLEQAMLDHPELLIDMPVTHRFTPGIYWRTIINPAGSKIVTKVHKVEHPFVLLRGNISTYVPEDGGMVEHLSAPHSGVTKAGTRRVIIAHTETVFMTFHPNPDNTTDLDMLESQLICDQRTLPDSGLTVYQTYQKILSERGEQHLIDRRM